PAAEYAEAAIDLSERRRAGGTTRLSVTSRAPELRRLHLARDAARVAVLIGADVTSLLLLWVALHATTGVPGETSAGPYVPAVVLGLALFGCYNSGDKRRQVDSLVKASGLGAVITLWAVNVGSPARWVTAVAALWTATAIALLLERRIVDLLVRAARPRDKQVMRAAVVGATESAARLIDHPAFADIQWCRLDAFLDPGRVPGDFAAALARLIRDREIDTVILTGNLPNHVFELALDVAGASGCRVFSLPRVPPSTTCLPEVSWRNGFPVVELTRPSVMGTQLLVKRATDLVLSSLALLALAPVMLVVAILVKRSSPGPVFFRQVRIGLGGRRFTIFKFRTMVQGADQQREALLAQSVYSDARLFKVVNDPRVTPLGAFLRRTSLDELPQLFNVLRGDMSLVGPRPPLPSEVELYQAHHYSRFDVKPGITGPWQVSGRNSIHDFDTVIRLESTYIRRWSLWLDLELLCRTVPVVLSGRGAH
ncbi:MAG TPA: sugar transferase, partial [Gemmatimonadales bacterium]|nr:sugar transferase [Gemmatimonadales bacterium]